MSKIVRSRVLRESFDREFEVMEDVSIGKLRAELNTQDAKRNTIDDKKVEMYKYIDIVVERKDQEGHSSRKIITTVLSFSAKIDK